MFDNVVQYLERAPTRAFSWLKAPTSTFTFKTLLRHFSILNCLKGMHVQKLGKLEDTKLDIKLMVTSSSNVSPATTSANAISEAASVNLSPTSKLRQQFQSNRQTTNTDATISNNIDPITKEFTRFESFSLAHKTVDVLQWWKTHSKTLPLLSEIARSVFTIPCSSSKSERTFSCAGLFSTKRRNRLGLQKLEDLVILKENRKSLLEIKADIDLSEVSKTSGSNSFDQIVIRSVGETTPCQIEDRDEHELFCSENTDESFTLSDDEDTVEVIAHASDDIFDISFNI